MHLAHPPQHRYGAPSSRSPDGDLDRGGDRRRRIPGFPARVPTAPCVRGSGRVDRAAIAPSFSSSPKTGDTVPAAACGTVHRTVFHHRYVI
uniref:Uncharacterized protein n=1 Tax=Oryza rufipogon TaxID=4529 RepID=A0A0E0P6H9_ORYRU